MADQKAIEQIRIKYAEMSESELIHMTYRYTPHSENHVAAQQLLDERRRSVEEERHREIQAQLKELKKPHNPSFWLLVISVTIAFVALVVAIFGLPQVQRSFSESEKFPEKKEQSQTNEQKSQQLKSDTPKK